MQQCTELTVTNRSRAYPERLFKGFGSSVCGFEGIVLQMARWLSWLERRPVTAEVVGSNPIRVALLKRRNNFISGVLAQLGEHLPYKQRVIGSSPIGPIFQKIC